MSYPSSSDEATKALLSLLIKNPATIVFDDMSGDWAPHGIINRVLTSEFVTDRILGVSKTATVSRKHYFLDPETTLDRCEICCVAWFRAKSRWHWPVCLAPAPLSFQGGRGWQYS